MEIILIAAASVIWAASIGPKIQQPVPGSSSAELQDGGIVFESHRLSSFGYRNQHLTPNDYTTSMLNYRELFEDDEVGSIFYYSDSSRDYSSIPVYDYESDLEPSHP
ncbi:hypothetical protein DSO57_1038488 [Entomophthora muscae]|uniref:Uncharacterized protein n=1 Tax=Entomophthora muscae TaxID=34485 RepID=A0ACC2U824_9FUNG|nr:hypothetical protein DSO57_1038488 [Entomophthora muscae]